VCINKSKTDLGVGFKRLISALQTFVDEHFAPVWGTSARLVVRTKPVTGAWHMWFLDHADHARELKRKEGLVLGKHYFNGRPCAKVFVNAILEAREHVSVAASHELAEMLVDPRNNRWIAGPKGLHYAFETSDPVEEVKFRVDGLPMCDFVYPAYFQASPGSNSIQLDHKKKIKKPFEILPGGFLVTRKGKNGKKVIMKFRSKDKERRFNEEDRRLHRSQFRAALVARNSRKAATNGMVTIRLQP